jgi:hypothetical protein
MAWDKDALREGDIKKYMEKASKFLDNPTGAIGTFTGQNLIHVSFSLTEAEAAAIFMLLANLREKKE